MKNVDGDMPHRQDASNKRCQCDDANLDRAGTLVELDEIKPKFADFLFLRPGNCAVCPNVQDTGYQPVTDFIQDDARQENCIVENRRSMEILGQQPANLKDVLV